MQQQALFPKIETATCLKKEKIATHLMQEDYLRAMLAKNKNLTYKSYNSYHCPINSASPYGDFPARLMNPKEIVVPRLQIHPKSQASTRFELLEGKKIMGTDTTGFNATS